MTGQEGPSCLLTARDRSPLGTPPHTSTLNSPHRHQSEPEPPRPPVSAGPGSVWPVPTPAGEPAAGATVRAAISVQSQSASASARQAGGPPLKTKGKREVDGHWS